MPAPDGIEPIADDEILYRRIPASQGWYAPAVDPHPSPQAFHPREDDTTGLSVHRAKYKTIEQAAKGRPGRTYYVAVLRAGDLRANGIDVVARPREGDPGHAELPGLTYENRRTDRSLEWKNILSQRLCLRVEGPFQG